MPSSEQLRHLAAKARRLAESQSGADVRKILSDYALECEASAALSEERRRAPPEIIKPQLSPSPDAGDSRDDDFSV